MIKLNALFKSFGSKKVLRGVNLEVDSGEIVLSVECNGPAVCLLRYNARKKRTQPWNTE